MSEFWQQVLLVVIGAAAGSLFTIVSSVIVARYSKPKTERNADLLTRFLQLSDMSVDQAVENFERIDAMYQKQLDRNKEIETLNSTINELKARIQADVMETGKLRNDYATAQKRIIKLEDLVISAGEYIDKIKTAVQSIPGVELPMNGELLDSVMRLKAERAQRGKQ